jgi:hypothetical protein
LALTVTGVSPLLVSIHRFLPFRVAVTPAGTLGIPFDFTVMLLPGGRLYDFLPQLVVATNPKVNAMRSSCFFMIISFSYYKYDS